MFMYLPSLYESFPLACAFEKLQILLRYKAVVRLMLPNLRLVENLVSLFVPKTPRN